MLEKRKEDMRNYRNYLAHYNCCETWKRREREKEITMDREERERVVGEYDGVVRGVIDLWKL